MDAMQPLLAADSAGPVRHYLLPLPPAIGEASPELFGFFTYEFRVGHAEGWSTARARFGLPHRLTGVQHPVPYLTCSVSRTTQHIRVSAPFAAPVADGQVQRAEPPNSELWGLLYVQVHLADASDWRNVLVGRTKLAFTDAAFRGRSGQTPHGLGYWDQDQVEAWLELFGLPHNSPQYIHLVAEIEKRVFADRAEYLGDPDYVDTRIDRLVSEEYMMQLSLTKGRVSKRAPDAEKPT